MTKMQTHHDKNFERNVHETARRIGVPVASVREIIDNFRNAVVKYDNKK